MYNNKKNHICVYIIDNTTLTHIIRVTSDNYDNYHFSSSFIRSHPQFKSVFINLLTAFVSDSLMRSKNCFAVLL